MPRRKRIIKDDQGFIPLTHFFKKAVKEKYKSTIIKKDSLNNQINILKEENEKLKEKIKTLNEELDSFKKKKKNKENFMSADDSSQEKFDEITNEFRKENGLTEKY